MNIQSKIQELWAHRVVRFACVGVINTFTDLAILNILVFAFGLKLIFANVISASISIVISYFWNHTIVFQGEHKISFRLFSKFVIVTGLSILAIQSLIIYVAEHLVTVQAIINVTSLSQPHAKLAQVNGAKLTAVAVGMVWNFVLYQLVVFKKPAPEVEDIDEEGVVPY